MNHGEDDEVNEVLVLPEAPEESEPEKKSHFVASLPRAARNRLMDAVVKGNHPMVAAALAGLKPQKVMRWLERGKVDESGPYHDFYYDVMAAQAKCEARAVAAWQKTFSQTYKASKDFLATRFPERWAPRQRVEHTGKGGGPIQMNFSALSEEEREGIRKIAAKIANSEEE